MLVATLFTLRHAQRRETRPGQALLEFTAVCFLYAAVYENGATFAGLWGMLQDFTLDPLAVRQVFESEGRAIGRWTWFLGPHDVNIAHVPVYNFPGWLLIRGLGSAFLLLGRAWFRRSGSKKAVGIAYPFLAALAGLVVLVLPSSQFFRRLAPFFGKGSRGEWIMLAVHFTIAAALLTFAWRGCMVGRFSLREDWPVFVLPAPCHLLDLAFAVLGGFYEVPGIQLFFGALHCGLLGVIWWRGGCSGCGAWAGTEPSAASPSMGGCATALLSPAR